MNSDNYDIKDYCPVCESCVGPWTDTGPCQACREAMKPWWKKALGYIKNRFRELYD